MVDPKIMCRKHLLGEHVELHMFLGAIKRGISMKGYVEKGLIQYGALQVRHQRLVEEMKSRRYKHNSPITLKECCNLVSPYNARLWLSKVDKEKSLSELIKRCAECKLRFTNLN